jgi:hypothetical protein
MFTLSSEEVLFYFGAGTIMWVDDPAGFTGPPFRLPIRLPPPGALLLELGTLWCTELDP